MQIKDLRRHLFCHVELNYYSDGTIALECSTCGKTLLMFCGNDCGSLVIANLPLEVKGGSNGGRPKKSRQRKKRSKEFEEKVRAVCKYHNSHHPKPIDFNDPEFTSYKNLSKIKPSDDI